MPIIGMVFGKRMQTIENTWSRNKNSSQEKFVQTTNMVPRMSPNTLDNQTQLQVLLGKMTEFAHDL